MELVYLILWILNLTETNEELMKKPKEKAPETVIQSDPPLDKPRPPKP